MIFSGSDVAAVFWGTFAATRGLHVVMWSSYSLCLAGSVLLGIFANESNTVLYIGTSLMGIGMASIFATGFLWLEQRIAISSKVFYISQDRLSYNFVLDKFLFVDIKLNWS